MGFAPIERLPLELLQQIYAKADYNHALLQSSPYIATRFSSEYIYNATCDYYLTEVHGERTKQSAAQTYIFACKWMTWDFFKSWCLRRFETPGCLCDRNPQQGCFDAQWPPNFNDATKMVFSRSHLPRLAFVKGRIPRKLLHGPWTQDKIEFLRFLLWTTSMSVDWHDPDMARTAIEGRRQAMVERNLEAVELFNHNRRLGKSADLDTVCFAVTQAGCDRSIVYDTLLALDTRSRYTDSQLSELLQKWCDDQAAAGNRKGSWLRRKLEECLLLSNQDDTWGLERRLERIGWLPRKACLDAETENYDGGPDDVLTTNKLEWNKVRVDLMFLIMPIAILNVKHCLVISS